MPATLPWPKMPNTPAKKRPLHAVALDVLRGEEADQRLRHREALRAGRAASSDRLRGAHQRHAGIGRRPVQVSPDPGVGRIVAEADRARVARPGQHVEVVHRIVGRRDAGPVIAARHQEHVAVAHATVTSIGGRRCRCGGRRSRAAGDAEVVDLLQLGLSSWSRRRACAAGRRTSCRPGSAPRPRPADAPAALRPRRSS